MSLMRGGVRWPIVLLPPACLLVVFLCVTAWRVVDQQQAVERERIRERLENAASLVARESERALAQSAADERASLSVRWDARGLRRTAGAPLPWSPAPDPAGEAPASLFAQAEELEFAREQPERALAEYRTLLAGSSGTVRAGALVRIARCQRKLGRNGDAADTYSALAALKAAPAAGSPAELVGRRERAALLEAMGDTSAASRERDLLKAALEQGFNDIDRATFEFFARGVAIDPVARDWGEAVEVLWKRAAGIAGGTILIPVRGRRFVAEWARDDTVGTGRLVDLHAVEQRLTKALEASSISWQLIDNGGAELGSAEPAGLALVKKPAETGLAWGIRVALPPRYARSDAPLLAGGLLLLSLSILGTVYLAYRVVRGELHVAKMQSEFVNAVSHEFRTPITALTHLTEMLESGDAAEERKPLYYGALARETRRLREMVENLLDFGRIEAGRYKYKPEDLDAALFVSGVVEEFRDQPATAGRELILEAGPGGRRVTADREALRRALWNLLDNAAKYSPAGSRITTKLSDENGWMSVTVQDEGPGIPAGEQKRIFQKFVRGRTAGEEHIRGTGIGLAMVEAIARAHGGRVELESRPGAGSRFTILLPCARR